MPYSNMEIISGVSEDLSSGSKVINFTSKINQKNSYSQMRYSGVLKDEILPLEPIRIHLPLDKYMLSFLNVLNGAFLTISKSNSSNSETDEIELCLHYEYMQSGSNSNNLVIFKTRNPKLIMSAIRAMNVDKKALGPRKYFINVAQSDSVFNYSRIFKEMHGGKYHQNQFTLLQLLLASIVTYAFNVPYSIFERAMLNSCSNIDQVEQSACSMFNYAINHQGLELSTIRSIF